MNKCKWLALALILILALSAPASLAASEEAPAATPTDVVLATVNGVDVHYAQVKMFYDYMLAQYASMIDTSDETVKDTLKQMAVSNAVTEQIVLQKAAEMGIDQFTDEELAQFKADADEAYDSIYAQYKAMFADQGATEEQQDTAAEAFLASSGYTRDGVRDQMMTNEVYQRLIATVTGDLVVDDAALRAAFDEKVQAAKDAYAQDLSKFDSDSRAGGTIYFVPEGVRAVKHILVKMDGAEAAELKNKIAELESLAEDAPERAEIQAKIDELKLPVQAKLDEIQAKIDAGEDFQALIDEYGEDPGMQPGSGYRDTGYYLSEGTVVYDPPFQAAAIALAEPGDVSEPVLGAYGFHIIRYDHDLESAEADFDAVKADMLEEVQTARKAEAESAALQQWSQEADVEIFMDRFTD